MIRTVRAFFYVTLALSALYVAGAWGAMTFNGTTEYAGSATAEITDTPLTIACWFRSTSTTTTQAIFGLKGNVGSGNEAFRMNARGAVAGDPVGAVDTDSVGTAGVADSTTGYSANTWHLGVAAFTDHSSRAGFIDGGSKGSETATTTGARTIDTTDLAAVETQGSVFQFFSGRIAECGIWNVVLADAEVATLGKGFAPPCVRRNALVAYYPMVRDTTSLKDLFSGTNHLTLTGGTVSDHPNIIRCQ